MDSPYDEAMLARAESILGDMSKHKSTRDRLLAQLKAQVSQDDINQLLVINKHNEGAVFAEELRKHQPLCLELDNVCKASHATLSELQRQADQIRKLKCASRAARERG